MEPGGRRIRIRGIVIPIEWDAGGNAIRAAIFTAGEDEYLIEENEKSERLLGLMQQEVEVTGMVREVAGKKIIIIADCYEVKRGANKLGFFQI